MRAAFICALMALSITGATAADDKWSANRWLPACKEFIDSKNPTTDTADLSAQGYCAGMVSGIAFMATASSVEARKGLLCADIPDEVTVGQQMRVVIRYIEARPKRMHENFKFLALDALQDAWPCRN